ncbi:MAG: helix-turn-helix domain-containing protein [Thermomicrobiales bacterium]
MDMVRGEMMSVSETARLLGRSTEQVRRYLREGVLTGHRIGGQWFIRAEDAAIFRKVRPASGSFLEQLAASDDLDPLDQVIGIGGSGGGNIAGGRPRYLQTLPRDGHP